MSLREIAKERKKNEYAENSSAELLRQQRERIAELEEALSEAIRTGTENLALARSAAHKRITEIESELRKCQQNEQQLSVQLETQLRINESLNNSDLQLKEAKRLQEENQRIRRSLEQREQSLYKSAKEARKLHDEAETTKDRYQQLCDDKRREIAKEVAKEAEKIQWRCQVSLTASICYGCLVTALTAAQSPVIVEDCKACGAWLWAALRWIWGRILHEYLWLSSISGSLRTDFWRICFWLAVIVGVLLIVGVMMVLLIIGVVTIFDFYMNSYYRRISVVDNKMLTQVLITLAVLVMWADKIRTIVPINLVALFLLIHVAYIVIRGIMILILQEKIVKRC